ncbi:sulfite exporter TauE/SafE family protein [Sutcliffiella sp. NC1]|uniref:sulfite exporter TauE/SafE family protein n=1 Tax=Sutcliffiella sp. NC1 TaxID=3004096 RepID=UPI0022DDBABC|nr:sulfite exporter TauE/SafE family protein [Sutcliffiella sp. NC1]WBL14356.1 sulfite exporter TauE/SafE family protein [Sutcliffiella sp. NC1]
MIFLLLIVGFIAGVVGSLVGLGGGIIIVPSLLFLGSISTTFHSITPQLAVGTSLVVIFFTGLSSTISYLKYKTVDYKSGLLLFLGSGPGTVIGAWVNNYLQADSFLFYYGLFILFISFILFWKDKMKRPATLKEKSWKRSYEDQNGSMHHYSFSPVVGLLISFFVGFTSGLFGVGGGALMVPAMIMLFMFPPHVAVATSMFIITLSSIMGSFTHISLGNVHWLFAALLIPGAWIGAKIGAWLNQRLTSKMVIVGLRIMLLIVGVRLLIEGLF